jgi:hypothetical protein
MNALLCPPAAAGEIAPLTAECDEPECSRCAAPALDFLKLSPLGLEVLRALNEAFDEAAEMAEMASDTITEFCRGE